MGSGSSKSEEINDKFIEFCGNYGDMNRTERDMDDFLAREGVDINYVGGKYQPDEKSQMVRGNRIFHYGRGVYIKVYPRHFSPLMTAILNMDSSSSMECVKLLLKKGADPNIANKGGFSPFSVVNSRCDMELLELLLQYNLSIPDNAMNDIFGMLEEETISKTFDRNWTVPDYHLDRYKTYLDRLYSMGYRICLEDEDEDEILSFRRYRKMFIRRSDRARMLLVLNYVDIETVYGIFKQCISIIHGLYCDSFILIELYNRGVGKVITEGENLRAMKIIKEFEEQRDDEMKIIKRFKEQRGDEIDLY